MHAHGGGAQPAARTRALVADGTLGCPGVAPICTSPLLLRVQSTEQAHSAQPVSQGMNKKWKKSMA